MDKMNITAEEAIDQIYKYGGKILSKDVGEMAAQAAKAKLIFGKAKQLVQYGKDIMNVLSMLKDYVAGNYTEVPWRIIAALSGAVVYVFSPVDVIPDLIPLFGFTDDATVFASVLSLARIDINSYLTWKFSKGEQIDGGSTECSVDVPTVDKSEDITDWSLKSFPDVVHTALGTLKGGSIHWFWGEENVASYRDNIYQKIMGGKGCVDDILGVIDMEAFEHCKEGFAFTAERIYFRQFMGESYSYKWREIIDFQRKGTKFYINGIPIDNICHDEIIAERVYKVIKAILNRADLTPEIKPIDETRRRSASQIAQDVFFSIPKGGYVFVGENIPEKKRANAHSAMGVLEPAAAISVLIDGTVLGSGKDGIAMTNRALYGNFVGTKYRIAWDELVTVVEQPNGNLIAYTLSGEGITLCLGSAISLKGVICEALNKLKEQIRHEPKRQLDAMMAKLHADQLARAGRYLNRGIRDSETEKEYIAAGCAVEEKIIAETTVGAQTNESRLDGQEWIVNNVPLTGGWKIYGKKVFLNEVIRIGENVRFFIEDAEIHFGDNGWFELDGGSASFKNCRFVCDAVVGQNPDAVGLNMFCGKASKCFFKNCEIDGGEARAAFCLDGDVSMTKCAVRNLYTNRSNSAVLGTPYRKDGRMKLFVSESSFENCAAKSQAMIWAMEASISNCEFIKCSSPSAMIVVMENSEFSLTECVFDQCVVDAGGAVVSLCSQGGSAMVEGMGVYTCWLKDCKYQYSHNVGIPINSLKGWVDESAYKEKVADHQPLFLRDGSAPAKQIGADISFNLKSDNTLSVGKNASSHVEDDEAADDDNRKRRMLSNDKKEGAKRTKKKGAVSHEQKVLVKAEGMTDSPKRKAVPSRRKARSLQDETVKECCQPEESEGIADDVADNIVKKDAKVKSRKTKREKKQDASSDETTLGSGRVKMGRSKQVVAIGKKGKSSRTSERIRMSVSDAVNTALSELGRSGFYEGANIPQKKLNNAVASMGIRVGEDVFALIDTTFFGSAKTGLVITNSGFHWKNDWTTDSEKSYYSWGEYAGISTKVKLQGEFELLFEKGSCFNAAGGGVPTKKLKAILGRIAELVT